MEKKTVTLRTWEYGVDVVDGVVPCDGKERVYDSEGVEVWCETRENKDRWYHAVCEDEGEGKRVLFDVARREEFKRGVPFVMLDMLMCLMQKELKPYGLEYVKVWVGFGGFGLDVENVVFPVEEREIPIKGDGDVNVTDEWATGICRMRDAETVKKELRGKLAERIGEEIAGKRKEIERLEGRLKAVSEG